MTPEEFQLALHAESHQFEHALHWLQKHLPPSFFEEIDFQALILIARHLLSFSLQDHHSAIHLKHQALVLSLDGPDADMRILKQFGLYAIRYYRAFVSNEPPPFYKGKAFLRIALVVFADAPLSQEETLSHSQKDKLFHLVKTRNPSVTAEELNDLLSSLTLQFIRSMPPERLTIALDLALRAKTRDQCQYEIRKNEEWRTRDAPSLQLIFAWRDVPKAQFLYRLAGIIYRHGLAIQKVAAIDLHPYSIESICILSLGLHGLKGGAAWEEADLDDFLREFVLLKYFETEDLIESTFVNPSLLTGNEAHLVRSLVSLSHQALTYADPNLYSFENVLEGFCRHPELTVQLCKAFEIKFHPDRHNQNAFFALQKELSPLIQNLDTGHPVHDLRRKQILTTALLVIHHTLKTNFYRNNKSSFAFRLHPLFLDSLPFDRREKFPDLPFGIFFIRGMRFIGFHIRFKDLARGGLRTVITERQEQYLIERNSIFSEAYTLAYTQQKKNKDIPEGGAKGAILLEPFDLFQQEELIYRGELERIDSPSIEEKCKTFRQNHRLAFLYSSQRSFIESLLTLVNCEENGSLRAKDIVDEWKKPEYIYLGPDENMHNAMIDWIANAAALRNYRPGRSFMSSKPGLGINHKEYGVTSHGVNVYMHEALLSLGIDPEKMPFTLKISGGPDGDVAGNQIYNLARYYPKTARLLALTDISGTIYDPQGLDLSVMVDLFHKALPIRNFPPDKLSNGGFLLDLRTKREETLYVQQTLCWRSKEGRLIEEWLPGNEMNHLYRNNVHQVKTDIFIPAGGRPKTLNESNVHTFLDETGAPSAKAIIEGANLYLTPGARSELEKRGVLIFKDSSCNKGGVICSSFEVLASLCLSEEEFLREKSDYVREILEIIRLAALHEASLILSTRKLTHERATHISDQISDRINLYKYQLLDYFETHPLPHAPHPLIRCLTLYCPPLLRTRYEERILALPDLHKKAIIACMIAARLVYSRGLSWSPHIIDILPTLTEDPDILRD